MKKILLLPDYLKKSFEKNVEKDKVKNYKVCFYPKNSAVRKVMDSGDVYNLEKMVAVGSEKEYQECKRVLDKCSFEKEIITLKYEEIIFKRFNKKTLGKVLREL
jgi:hypothetical protein